MESSDSHRSVAPIGLKRAVSVVQAHYQADTRNLRKLCTLFSDMDYDKQEARGVLMAEARRILDRRAELGVSSGTCQLCGQYANKRRIKARPAVQLHIDPSRPRFRGWLRRSIDSPVLCNRCDYIVRSEIARYKQLIEVSCLIRQLERTQADNGNH